MVFARLGTARSLSRPFVVAVVAASLRFLDVTPAHAQDDAQYVQRASEVLARLLDHREYKPEPDCAPVTYCETLLARLRAGEFRFLAPSERADSPLMPSYVRLRQKCRNVDLVHIGTVRHRLTATRNFAVYRLGPSESAKREGEVMIFRAEHYVAADARGGASEVPAATWPGTFVAVAVARCRVLATATAEEGDRYAKHNPVSEDEHLSELLVIDGRLFVLNLLPVVAGHEPKQAWWYKLSLIEWGAFTTLERQGHRPTYEFNYRPTTLSEQSG